MGATRKMVVGAFVIVGLLLFGVGLFLIGNRKQLFEQSFEVNAEFEELAGLQNGASVRVAGLVAGEVLAIYFPSSPAERFRVHMRVIEDLHPLVRQDSVAIIQTEGVVGNKLIEIGSGSTDSPMVTDGGTILSREPMDITDLFEQASDTAETLNETILWARSKLDDTIVNMEGVLVRADEMFDAVGDDVTAMSASGKEIAAELEGIVAGVQRGEGTIGKLLKDDELHGRIATATERLESISADAKATFENVRQMSERATEFVSNIGSDAGPATGLVADLQGAVSSAREALSDLAENTESMKRSFLFRGLFMERGFYDLDTLTPTQYVEGALLDDHRTERFWIPAERLVEETPRGEEVLSEAGKASIRAAMRDILRYPPLSPLMVEGYADAGSLDEQFLAARRRAQLVHDYIVRVFHRDPNYTGFVVLDDVDLGELDDDGEDRVGGGVVLALYYDDDVSPAPRPRVVN